MHYIHMPYIHSQIYIYNNVQTKRMTILTHKFCGNQDIISYMQFLKGRLTVQTSDKVKSLYPTWASCQIHKIAGCACAGNAGDVFPATDFKRKPLFIDHGLHHARALIHVGIANSRWLWKRSRHSATRKFTYLVRGQSLIHFNTNASWLWKLYWFLAETTWFVFMFKTPQSTSF